MTTLVQASFAKGEVAPAIHGRVDTAAYQVALRTARNINIRAHGGASNRPGLALVGPVKDHSYAPRLIEFQFKTSDTYVLEFGDFYMRVIRDGGHVLEASKVIDRIYAENPLRVETNAAHSYSAGDEVYIEIDEGDGMPEASRRRFVIFTTPTANTFTLKSAYTSVAIDGTGYAAYIPFSSGTVARVLTVASPFAIEHVDNIKYVQSADKMTLTHPSYAPRELRRSSHTSWAFTTPTFAPTIAAPTGVAVAPGGGAVSRTYAVTAIKAETLEESLATQASTTTGAATPADSITWSAVTGAVRYTVYLQSNGIFAFLGETENLGFVNSNISPDLSVSPPSARDPFNATDKYPAAVGYFNQRRVFGGTNERPDTSFYSRTGAESNMSSSSPPQDDDAITATLPSLKINEIRHYVPGSDLLIFTSGSEWQINSGNDAGFSATTLKQYPQSTWGVSHLAPIVVGKTVLYVSENGISVRSMGYSWQINGYTGNDVSLLSSHLFEQYKIVDSAFARFPDPIAHYVREDGQVACLTFNQEQEMIAWTRWDTAGKFERVCSMRRTDPEVDETVYFVVKRLVDGFPARIIERTHSRRFTDVRDAFFVDSGVTYDEPKDITDIQFAADGTVTVVSEAHGLVDGDEVDIFDVSWVPETDEYGNETQPDQINGRRYTVTNATTDTFDLEGEDGSDMALYAQELVSETNGTVRKAVSTVRGAEHLEGKRVAVLADGNVVSNITVEDGQITLPRKFSRVHFGLPYVADLETLNIETPNGTIQGKEKKITTATIRFEKSRGLLYGTSSDELFEMKQREFEAMGDPTELLTGDEEVTFGPKWNTKGRIFLRQMHPLPMTILAIIPDLAVSR